MKAVRKQLTAFHSRTGLSGEALKDAVRQDLVLVLKNSMFPIERIDDTDTLDLLFVWETSAQGDEYWRERCW
ncbi:hypothetical protein D3C85_566420 [compost metagenome]